MRSEQRGPASFFFFKERYPPEILEQSKLHYLKVLADEISFYIGHFYFG